MTSRAIQPLAYATCLISGDRAEPAFWTKYFGLEPEIAVVKGQPFRTPSGRMSSQPGRTGVWGYSSKFVVQADMLDPHIGYLISRLSLPRADLPGLLDKSGAKLRFLCFWANYSGDRNPTVDPHLEHLVESSGGIIEIDEYPQKQ